MSLEDEEREEEEEKPRKVRPSSLKQKSQGTKRSLVSDETKKIKVLDESSSKDLGDEKRSPEDKWFDDGELTVDVYQTGDDIVVQSAVAGVKPEDLDIAIENDMVTIKGERRNSTKEEKKNYIHQECFWGTFSRQILLPEEVDSNRAEASFQEGVLTLRLPKINRQKVKKIKLS